MTMPDAGFLLIWSDIDEAAETDYLHWLMREHTTERLATEGFIAVRVFRSLVANPRRYLINYELGSAAAISSPDYVSKLNNPTPWTRRIMPQLRNFIRSGGSVACSAGLGRGGYVAALPCAALVRADDVRLVEALARCDRIAAVRLYETDRARTSIRTTEKETRGMGRGADDQSFACVLLIEGSDADAVRAAHARLPGLSPDSAFEKDADPAIYGAVFALDKRMLP